MWSPLQHLNKTVVFISKSRGNPESVGVISRASPFENFPAIIQIVKFNNFSISSIAAEIIIDVSLAKQCPVAQMKGIDNRLSRLSRIELSW